jgi:hypothetical protein
MTDAFLRAEPLDATGIAPIKYPENMVFHMPNCGIVAMAICARVPYEKSYEWFRLKMNKRGNWRGKINHIHCAEFLRLQGIWFTWTKYDKARIRTIGDFATWGAKPGVLYAVRSRGHLMTVKDGWICDQSSIATARVHWCRNKRVLDTWEIVA